MKFGEKGCVNRDSFISISRESLNLLPQKHIKIFILTFFIIIFTYFFLPTIDADIISLNPGGNEEFVITPDKYIEGFFFGGEVVACIPDTCASLGYNCGSWSDGCGGTLNCGTCVSGYTCSAGTCTAVTPPGGGGGVVTPTYNIMVEPTEFNIYMQTNTNIKKIIKVTNLESSAITIRVTQSNLTNMIILGNTSLTIPAKQTVDLGVIFAAPEEPGIYTGRIIIGSKQVLVALNVRTELLLFDSNIVVLNEDYEVRQGEQLRTLVTLIPMGDPIRLDVTLNFVIKDYTNKIYLTRSETLLVNEQVQLGRNFDTGALPLGDYVVGLELIYPGGVAPSSAHFKVIERPISFILGKIILFLIILILIIAIIIIILLIIRKIKERRAQKTPSPPATLPTK